MVEDSLATGRISIAVAGYARIDIIVVDAGIEHGFAAGLEAQFGVVHKVAWFDEAGEAIAYFVSVREQRKAFWYNRVPSLPMTYAGTRSMMNKVCAEESRFDATKVKARGLCTEFDVAMSSRCLQVAELCGR